MAGSGYRLFVTFKVGGSITRRVSEADARAKWANLKKDKENPPVSGYIEKPDGTKIPLD